MEEAPKPKQEFSEEERRSIMRQRGGFVSGESRRGEIERSEAGEGWKLTEKGQEAVYEKAKAEDEAREAAKKEEAAQRTIEKEKPPEAAIEKSDVRAEVERLPENERKKLGIGLGTIGFFVEETKDKFFAKVFGSSAGSFKEKSTLRRFFSALSENFSRDAERARKNIDEAAKGRSKKLSSTGYLIGNIIKYGRTAADVVGWTAASPFRYVMISAMGFARGAEAAKEARLKNEKVIEKTRIDDIDQAFDAAMKVREEAQEESGVGPEENPTKEALEKAYSRGIPRDILERLTKDPEPGIVSGIAQRIARWHAERSAKNVERKLDMVERNARLSEEQRKNKRDKLLNRYSRRLRDLDRMVTKYGTVDTLALGAQAAEKGAKAVVAGLMVESVVLAAQKLWEVGIPGLMSALEQPPKAPPVPENITVRKGDSVWKIIERQLATQRGTKFTNLDEGQKTYIIDALKDKIVAEPGNYGLTDSDKIKVGQKIHLGELFADQKGLENIFGKAGALTEVDLDNIKRNNLILREWVRNHPDQRLTFEKAEAIFKGVAPKPSDLEFELKEPIKFAAPISETKPEEPVFTPEAQETLIQKAGSDGMPRYMVERVFSNTEDMNKTVSGFLIDADSEYRLTQETAPEAGWTSEQIDLARERKELADFIRKKTGDFRGGPYGNFKMKDFLAELAKGYK